MSGNINGISSVSYYRDSVDSIEDKNSLIEETIETTVEDVSSSHTSSVSGVQNSESLKEYANLLKSEMLSYNIETDNKLLAFANDIKDSISEVMNKITNEDMKSIFNQHYSPEKVSIDILKNIVETDKSTVEEEDYEALEEEALKSVEEFKTTVSDTPDFKSIIHSLVMNNLPVNTSNINKIKSSLSKFDTVQNLSVDEMMSNLCDSGDFTLDNVYKNKFTASSANSIESLDELEDQIVNLMEANDLEVTDESMELSKKIIGHGVEFNPDNMDKAKAMLGGFNYKDRKDIAFKAAENIKNNVPTSKIDLSYSNGVNSEEVNTISTDEIESKMTELGKIQLGDIESVINGDNSLNISNLISESQSNSVATVKLEDGKSYNIDTLRAKLNVEEIRLKMTAEAANKMSGKGFDIDTESIEDVVNELREFEKQALEEQLEINQVGSVDSQSIEAREVVEQLSYIRIAPFSGISMVVNNEIGFTIQNLGTEAINEISTASPDKLNIQLQSYRGSDDDLSSDELKLQQLKIEGIDSGDKTLSKVLDLKLSKEDNVTFLAQKALNRYEIMETKPRSDMGDSIQKAFTQIDSILEDLNVENSEANQRAVKILAYNNMEITNQQIEMIKNIDLKVTKVTDELHPTVVMNMLKDELSPLDMDIDEVISYMEKFDEEYGETNFEKIAKVIYDMESNGELKESDREGMIGVYRVLSTISRSTGRAAGFLVNNELEVNVNNLFEAAKYIRQSHNGNQETISANIDDEFGMLDEKIYTDKTIKEGIDEALEATRLENAKLEIENFISEKIADDYDTVNNIGNYEQLVADLDGISTLKAEDIHLLENNEMTLNVENLKALRDIKDNGFALSDRLMAVKDKLENSELDDAYIQNVEEAIEGLRLSEDTTDYSDKVEELRTLLEEIEAEVLATNDNSGEVNEEVSEGKNLLEMNKPFANEEYYQIPLIINGNISQLNMYYVNDEVINSSEENELKVYVYFKTQNLGKVQGYMNIKDNNMSFQMFAESSEALESIKDFSKEIEQVFEKSAYNFKGVAYEFFEGESPISEQIQVDSGLEGTSKTDGAFEIIV